MQSTLKNLLQELENFGQTNDLEESSRQQKMLNITPETGVFLSIMIQTKRAQRVLEIGASNGYSTLWLADAVSKTNGKVITIEIQDHKFEKAKTNFDRSGLKERIHQVHGDAGTFLKSTTEVFDLIFLDSDRDQYADWWSDIIRIMSPGGLVIVDNAISHKEELAEFRALIDRSKFESSLIPIGKGELVILKPL
jgi:predicted O-methyltransferase YrrM